MPATLPVFFTVTETPTLWPMRTFREETVRSEYSKSARRTKEKRGGGREKVQLSPVACF
jgi:hypothetical protein